MAGRHAEYVGMIIPFMLYAAIYATWKRRREIEREERKRERDVIHP